MEDVKKFVDSSELDGDGLGGFYGDGRGNGYGNGNGKGDGDGDSNGDGDGNGNGKGFGFGHGTAVFGTNPFGTLKSVFVAESFGSCGFGNGKGNGFGDGFGDGGGYCGGCNGKGKGLKSVNGYALFEIDGIPTGIYKARGNVAKGFILQNFAPVDCYIVKDGDTYAHGITLREAEDALLEKIMENMDEDEAIEKFVERFKPNILYQNREFFEWHHYLTGSCRMGRENFCSNHGVDMDGESTPEYFIELTKNAYGGETIRKLEKHYTKQGERK